MIGKTVSHYKILEKLGSGGMGEVYKAQDTKLKRSVALKFLPPHLTQDPEAKKRFIKEAQAASALQHNNICTIYEINETDQGQLYISMEHLNGETLKEKISGRGEVTSPLQIEEVMDIITQIARGLEKAHKKGIIHRDIKPANIMITEDGTVKIVDFGLAKLAGQTKLTKTGSTLGTVAYMSPEQTQGTDIDQRTDIWALGVILYEMLAGEHPFKGDYEQAVVYSILNEDPKSLNDLHPEIPSSIEQVVSKALEKIPNQRYQTTEELLDDLKSISAGIVPEEIKARLRKAKLLKRKRSILYAAAVGLVIVMAVLALTLFTGRAEAIDSIAVLPLENLTGDTEKEFFVDVATEELIGQLGKIEAWRVISRTSVMKFKDTDKTLSEIARELNVDCVVEGSVQQAGDRVRIQVRLIDALPEEQNLWGQTYERTMSDVLVMYGEMARAIAEKAQIDLTADELTRLTSARQVNPESYDAYLKGSANHERGSPEGLKIALQYYNLALEKDPNNALALVGISGVWGMRYQFGMVPRQEAMTLIKTPIEKALELDNTLAEAHSALAAHKCFHEWDWEGAEKEFQQALRLNPNLAGAHSTYSHFLCIMGRTEKALPHIELALELDPLNPLINYFYGMVLGFNRRYDDALIAFRTTSEIEPNFVLALFGLANTLRRKGMHDEALAIWRKAYADDAEITAALEDGYEKAGYYRLVWRG